MHKHFLTVLVHGTFRISATNRLDSTAKDETKAQNAYIESNFGLI
jgi:hypothetical protein